MGLRYNYSQYHTVLYNDPSQHSSNYYNSMEVWGGENIGKRFQVIGFVPFYFNKQIDDDGTTTPHGLGDITVIGQYEILNTSSINHNYKMLHQQLWVGAGIKLATGSYNLDVTNPDVTVADVNAELGTGSTDFLLTSLYNLKIKDFGINASANYKMNTVNRQQYKYGNKLSTNLIAFYQLNTKNVGITPNAGLGYEVIASNSLSAKKVQNTGSSVSNAIMGMECTYRKIGLGLNVQVPIVQNFAEGQTQLRIKGMAHLTFGF